MARTPLLNLRVDAERKARWEAAAKDAGCSLAEFVRDTIDAVLAEPVARELVAMEVEDSKRAANPPPPPSPKPTPPGIEEHGISPRRPKKRRERTEMCVHRRRPDQFCSKCDG